MFNLLKIQLHKILHYRIFWGIIIIFLLSFAGGNYAIFKIVEEILDNAVIKMATTMTGIKISIFDFPIIWNVMAWIGGFYQMILAVIIIVDISNEFSFRTMRQNMIDGLDRRDFVVSKFWLIFLLSVAFTVILTIYILIMGLIFTEAEADADIWQGAEYMLAFFIQCIGYLSLAMLVAVLVKKAGLALIILFAYSFIENVVAMRYKGEFRFGKGEDGTLWTDFLPLQMQNNPIPPAFFQLPNFGPNEDKETELNSLQDMFISMDWNALGLSAVTCAVFVGLAYYVLMRRDA
jgi:ABC-type transport system involved in multi-copper enzyme maturation permease subunit